MLLSHCYVTSDIYNSGRILTAITFPVFTHKQLNHIIEYSLLAKPVIDRTSPRNNTGKLVGVNIGTSINVKVGTIVRIYCKVTGLPSPSITWTVTKEVNRRKQTTRLQVFEYSKSIKNFIGDRREMRGRCPR